MLTDVLTLTNNVIESPDFASEADGYYKGGFLFWLDIDGVSDRRMIVDHVGSFITLMSPIPGLKITDQVTVFPGCKHTLADCKDKFNNIENYGGMPYSPTVSPFNTPLY